jgi:hypothetical protein
MKSEPIAVFALEPDQQRPKLINPCKRSFNHEPLPVDLTLEMSPSPTFDPFTIAFVLRNVRTDPSIPQHLPCFSRIKGCISVKDGTLILQPTSLHIFEQLQNRLFEIEAIIMLPGNDTSRGNNEAIPVNQRDDIAGLGFLSPLIANTFAPFLATVWLPSRLSADKMNDAAASCGVSDLSSLTITSLGVRAVADVSVGTRGQRPDFAHTDG